MIQDPRSKNQDHNPLLLSPLSRCRSQMWTMGPRHDVDMEREPIEWDEAISNSNSREVELVVQYVHVPIIAAMVLAFVW
jgi:hypothetical protein